MKITEDSILRISYGALIAVLAIILGFGGWMTSMELRAQDHSEKLTVLQSIDKRLYRIEIMLKADDK